jgi:hypothetical protein
MTTRGVLNGTCSNCSGYGVDGFKKSSDLTLELERLSKAEDSRQVVVSLITPCRSPGGRPLP